MIRDIQPEASGIKSVYLEAQDGQPIADFEPGQYLGIKIRPPGHEYDEIRQYSLSNAPAEAYYRITVKAESTPSKQEGKISNHLHQAQPGDVVWVQP